MTRRVEFKDLGVSEEDFRLAIVGWRKYSGSASWTGKPAKDLDFRLRGRVMLIWAECSVSYFEYKDIEAFKKALEKRLAQVRTPPQTHVEKTLWAGANKYGHYYAGKGPKFERTLDIKKIATWAKKDSVSPNLTPVKIKMTIEVVDG